MIITSRGYMQTRSLEAGLGAVMMVSGIMFMTPGMIDTTGPAYAQLRTISPSWLTEFTGGLILFLVALARWVALAVNSHHRSTPLFRLAGCAVGAAFWLTVTMGFATAGLPSTPWICGICGCLAAKELYSGFRTGLDADALDSLGIRIREHHRRRAARG